ncbi:MAG: hypothetical protein JSS68_14985 [Actinobacteria bacterium]|nr:hypothetical protein [Actinomycetota bacterium]
MPKRNPPELPAELSRPDAQMIIDAINVRLWKVEEPGEWIAAPFQGTWENYGGGWAAASYRRLGNTLVTLRGLVKHSGSTGSSVIFTLPSEYRPSESLLFAQWAETTGGASAMRVDVYGNGSVVAQAPAEAVNYLSLNLSFYID